MTSLGRKLLHHISARTTYLSKPIKDDMIILDSFIIPMAEGGAPAAAAASSSSSSYSKDDVNQQFLESLMEMGIHRDDARQVFLFC
jgi:hypothetical protein